MLTKPWNIKVYFAHVIVNPLEKTEMRLDALEMQISLAT